MIPSLTNIVCWGPALGRETPRHSGCEAVRPKDNSGTFPGIHWNIVKLLLVLRMASIAIWEGGWSEPLLELGSVGYGTELLLCACWLFVIVNEWSPRDVQWSSRDYHAAVRSLFSAFSRIGIASERLLTLGRARRNDFGGRARATQSTCSSRVCTLAARRPQASRQDGEINHELEMRICVKNGDIEGAASWIKHMSAQGIPVTQTTHNKILEAFSRARNPGASEQWLRRMSQVGVEPDATSFAVVVRAHARTGDAEQAEIWFNLMLDAGFEPNAGVYSALIHACAVTGNVVGAELWLEQMGQRNKKPNLATYTCLIRACGRMGDILRAEKWLAHMAKSNGVQPDVMCYNAVLDACAKSGNYTRAEHWYEHLMEQRVELSSFSYSAIITALAKAGASGVQEVMKWLDRAEDRGCNDAVMYNMAIDACGKAGDAERAAMTFRRMQDCGHRPDVISYAALARPYSHRGDWGTVESIGQRMAGAGVKPNEHFIYTQLLAYASARPRQAEKAEECFRQVVAMGIPVNDYILVALVRSVGRPCATALLEELCNGREITLPPQRRASAGGRRGEQHNGQVRGGRRNSAPAHWQLSGSAAC